MFTCHALRRDPPATAGRPRGAAGNSVYGVCFRPPIARSERDLVSALGCAHRTRRRLFRASRTVQIRLWTHDHTDRRTSGSLAGRRDILPGLSPRAAQPVSTDDTGRWRYGRGARVSDTPIRDCRSVSHRASDATADHGLADVVPRIRLIRPASFASRYGLYLRFQRVDSFGCIPERMSLGTLSSVDRPLAVAVYLVLLYERDLLIRSQLHDREVDVFPTLRARDYLISHTASIVTDYHIIWGAMQDSYCNTRKTKLSVQKYAINERGSFDRSRRYSKTRAMGPEHRSERNL
jgi:hypothetical protein